MEPRYGKTKKVGKPAVPIDAWQVEFMASLFSTQQEMADFFGITQQSLSERLQREPLKTAYQNGLAAGRLKLRSAQMKAATENLNPAILIWLGKQKGILDQRDQPVQTTPQDVNISVRYVAEWGATPTSLGDPSDPSPTPPLEPSEDPLSTPPDDDF
jgi:hypothetical protein